jgi:2-polyprenyl-3-methyl-5-hydroxy-6-metoxy-1,4-benzoquinol methylase
MLMEERFTRLAASGAWGSPETPCGPGSTLEACRWILERLPEWIRTHQIRSIADLGCGDFHWMSRMDLSGIQYDGYDVVRFLVQRNAERYGRDNVRFHHADLTTLDVPLADLVILKDVLIHLPTSMALEVVARVLEARPRFLASTTAPGWPVSNRACMKIGEFSPIDLEASPFQLRAPIGFVEVPHGAGRPIKHFALWRL